MERRDGREWGQLRGLLHKASKKGDFTLASGRKSDWYLDCRVVTTTRSGLRLVASELMESIQTGKVRRPTVLGGPASAAIATMAAFVASYSTSESGPRGFVYTRDKAKDHGTQQQVDGLELDPKEDKLLLVDDVLTSGGSLLKSRDAILAKYPGLEIVGAWVLVDRAEGGRDRLMQEGIRVHAPFSRLDILT